MNKISGGKHRLKRADCISWLQSRSDGHEKSDKFDLIFLDPPTFSNSKNTENVLNIQRDHVSLITNAMRKLEKTGLLIFSTNKLNFKLDPALLEKYKIQDYSNASLGKDFQRQKKPTKAGLLITARKSTVCAARQYW